MAEPRIYTASTASLVAVNGQGVAVPLGLVRTLRLEKRFIIERVNEFGNYRPATILTHGIEATFSWDRAYSAGIDLVGQGLIPATADIAQFQPFLIRVIDQLAQRQIAVIERALCETVTLGADARSHLLQSVSGQCIDIWFESEVN